MTEAQANRTKVMMEQISKGLEVRVEKIGGTVYGFCSELASLRIFAKYNCYGSVHSKNVRAGYSENMKSHYVSVGE